MRRIRMRNDLMYIQKNYRIDSELADRIEEWTEHLSGDLVGKIYPARLVESALIMFLELEEEEMLSRLRAYRRLIELAKKRKPEKEVG